MQAPVVSVAVLPSPLVRDETQTSGVPLCWSGPGGCILPQNNLIALPPYPLTSPAELAKHCRCILVASLRFL